MNGAEQKSPYPERSCPQCGYRVVNRFIKKCPRCLSMLPAGAQVSACGGCVQQCAPAPSCRDDQSNSR